MLFRNDKKNFFSEGIAKNHYTTTEFTFSIKKINRIQHGPPHNYVTHLIIIEIQQHRLDI